MLEKNKSCYVVKFRVDVLTTKREENKESLQVKIWAIINNKRGIYELLFFSIITIYTKK